MTRTHISDCSHCKLPLGEARLLVHSPDPSFPSGEYHNKGCFEDACAAVAKGKNAGREGAGPAGPAQRPSSALEIGA